MGSASAATKKNNASARRLKDFKLARNHAMRRNKGAAHCAALCVYSGEGGNAGVNCFRNVRRELRKRGFRAALHLRASVARTQQQEQGALQCPFALESSANKKNRRYERTKEEEEEEGRCREREKREREREREKELTLSCH